MYSCGDLYDKASHQDFFQKSYLFNELSYGKKTDLEDDVETSVFGSNNLESFVKNTVLKIHKAVPSLYLALEEKI